MNRIRALLLFGLLSLLPGLSFASDVMQPQSTLYPFRNMIEMQDDFITGTASSGAIGNLGFSGAGTITFQPSAANRFGLVRFDTTAVVSTIARINTLQLTSFLSSNDHSNLWAARLNTNDANTTMRVGFMAFPSTSPPVDGIFFEKLDADTNWFCVTRAASTQTRVDTTVAVSTNFANFDYTRNSSGVQFALNGTNVCGLMTTNIPTVAGTPSIMIINSAAAAKTFDVDYVQFRILGIAR